MKFVGEGILWNLLFLAIYDSHLTIAPLMGESDPILSIPYSFYKFYK